MAEEAAQAPAEGQDTPTEGAPPQEDTREQDAPSTEDTASDATEPDHDWEKRYSDLRPQFDRQAQELKEAQQYQQVVSALQSEDPAERQWAADILGLEFGDEDDSETPDDTEEEFRDPRVDQLLQEREQHAHLARLEGVETHISSAIDELDKKHKVDLSDDEKELVFAATLALPVPEDGQPPVSQAFEMVTGIFDNRIKKYRETKRDAPSAPAPGSSGSTQVQPGDRKSRLELANQVAQRALMRGQ